MFISKAILQNFSSIFELIADTFAQAKLDKKFLLLMNLENLKMP